eukprot:gb/GECG01001746.1/.p1 GENE.gb/GECG01001746.1/~~gb/GECG01001746.1/.p1  ORF type:complete len:945 (+),score=108.62 gb/GECG01001746.1/:1-2835(+)
MKNSAASNPPRRVFKANSRGSWNMPGMMQDKRLIAIVAVVVTFLVYVTFRPIPESGSIRRRPDTGHSNIRQSTGSHAPPPSDQTSPGQSQSSANDEGEKTYTHKELDTIEEKFEPGPKKPLNPPHGGELVDLLASSSRARELKTEVAPKLKSWTLSSRQLCDLELIANGGFSPLNAFMDKKNYESVVENMRLSEDYNNLLWPMPITLDVSEDFSRDVEKGTQLALRDEFFNLIAVMTVSDKYTPDKENEAQKVFRTTDRSHPSVGYLFYQAGNVYLGGSFEVVEYPKHYDFPEHRRTPKELREYVESLGWSRFLAFQTRNPMHRAHIELTRLVQDEHDVGVIIHPSVGMTKPGDVAHYVRIRCYKAILDSHRYYKRNGAALSLLHLAMRMAGPREAVWHALIRKNHGASHFIIGRDHAGCKDANGEDFYGPYDAQELAQQYEDELGITLVRFKKVVYVPAEDKYFPEDRLSEGAKTLSLSGTQFRAMMNAGSPIPAWFSDPEVIRILQEVSPPKHKRGFAIFFSGLSGGGKTTVSQALIAKIKQVLPTRHITMLDGDVARTHLSSELGFSVADRNLNIARMGFVAAEAVRHTGIVVASTISPFEKSREESRKLVDDTGGRFILVQMSTSAQVCADRDVKGLYAMARDKKIDLTGVSHPYEQPEKADLIINGEVVPVETSAEMILAWLYNEGYLTKEVVGESIASIDLKNDGVTTSETPDAGSRNCINRAGGTSGSKRPLLVFVVSATPEQPIATAAQSIAERAHASSVDVSNSVFTDLATERVQSRFDETARKKGKTAARVGKDVMTSFSEDDKPEPAFTIWQSVRIAGGTGQKSITGTEKLPEDVDGITAVTEIPKAPEAEVVTLPPNAISIIPNLLRIDPCAQAVIANVDQNGGNGVAHGLQARFPTRIALANAEGETLKSSDESKEYATVDGIVKSVNQAQ